MDENLNKQNLNQAPEEDFGTRIDQLEKIGLRKNRLNKLWTAIGLIVIVGAAAAGIYFVYPQLPDMFNLSSQPETSAPIDFQASKCVAEGDSASISNGEKCCGELSLVRYNDINVGYCTDCGDGICKFPEDMINCPLDCVQSDLDMEGDLILATTSTSTILATGTDMLLATGTENDIATTSEALPILATTSPLGTEVIPVVIDGLSDNDGDELVYDDEIKYGTDPENPDSDGDGYLDGKEVASGYNPLGDGKLIE